MQSLGAHRCGCFTPSCKSWRATKPNFAPSLAKLAACGGLLGAGPSGDAAADAMPKEEFGPLPRVAVACWNRTGGFVRYSSPADALIHLVFGKPSADVPRPGMWYCPKCGVKNITCRFFCKHCEEKEANVSVAVRVPDGTDFPRSGDWGCGTCGEALCGYQEKCPNCGGSKSDPRVMLMP